MEDREKLLSWFREEKDYWIGCICSHNNPMYIPMVMGLSKSGKKTCVQCIAQSLSAAGKPIVKIMVEYFEKEGDEVVAVIYYFHVDMIPVDGDPENVKKTLLTFNIFVPSVEGVYMGDSFVVKCETGNGGMKTDKVTVDPMELGVDEIPHLKSLWQNPFL